MTLGSKEFPIDKMRGFANCNVEGPKKIEFVPARLTFTMEIHDKKFEDGINVPVIVRPYFSSGFPTPKIEIISSPTNNEDEGKFAVTRLGPNEDLIDKISIRFVLPERYWCSDRITIVWQKRHDLQSVIQDFFDDFSGEENPDKISELTINNETGDDIGLVEILDDEGIPITNPEDGKPLDL